MPLLARPMHASRPTPPQSQSNTTAGEGVADSCRPSSV